MSTPFSWESQRTKTIEPFKRTLPQSLMAAVDNMFEGTLNPGAHRQNWFDFLQSNAAGDVATDLGITDETDLSLMLPPIENINLPLLQQLRETLSELNADACCYPYSARNATEIKTIVNLYNAVKAKTTSSKQKIKLEEIRLNKEELQKTGIKVQLMTRAAMPTTERKRNLARLTTQVSRIRSMRRAIAKQKKDLSMLANRQIMFRDRLERIFFSRPNWKFKDTRGKRAVGSVDRIDANDIEIISQGQTISHQTIVEAIQERVGGLKQASIDIHPIPWKNLLIIPYAVKGLTPGWDQAEGKDYRLGQARNKIKTNNFRRASALIATWEQFATFGTKGFANTLQKDLEAHNVKLHAQVEISFDVNGTIRPNVPWWDNEYAADNGKRQVGGQATAEQEQVRDNYDGLGAGVGVYHTKTSSNGVQFYSQVGFAWQYKLPTHSRSNLSNTDWILATDENGDPFKEFNLPKGTTEYAVRLCFIKADGNVVPISNVLTGSDVQQKMEALINRKIKGKRFVAHADRYSVVGDKDVSGTREDATVWTQVSETDRKRLTRKARALLNIQAEVNMETFTQKIIPLKQILNSYDKLVVDSEARLENVRNLTAVLDSYLAQANERLDDGTRMDGSDFTDPTTGAVVAAPTVGSTGADVNTDVPLMTGFKIVDETTLPTALDNLFATTVTTGRADTDYDSENPIDVIQQARTLRRLFTDPATNTSIAARDSAIDKYNAAASAVEDMEQKMVAWSAGGHYDNFSTEHAPGLVSKDREVTQVISFTKTRFPSKQAKEERDNNAAAIAGTPLPHVRTVPIVVTDPLTGVTSTVNQVESTAGLWNPFTEDLPDEACLMMEPQLRTFRDEESLGLLNAGQLRAHNYSASPLGTVDVSGETPSIGFTAWKNEQGRMATKFNDAKNPRDLTPDEQRINDFNSRNISSKINFSLKSSRAAALLQAQKQKEKEEREKFEKQEAALKAQLDNAQQARATLQANRDAEVANVRATDTAAKATALELVQLSQDIKNEELDLAKLQNEIALLQSKIDALETIRLTVGALDAGQQQEMARDKAMMATQNGRLKTTEQSIEALEEKLTLANKKYNEQVAAGIQKREADLDRKILDAEKALESLNKQFRITLRAAETAAQEAAARLEKRVAILAASTQGDILGLEEDIISGNIAIDAKNAALPPDSKIAPADLRFGGGYYWKQSEDIKSSPFGQYLAYDPTGTKGDRLELMWSELNPDDSTQAADDVVLYRYTDKNTPSVRALVERKNVQPVLTDNIHVKGVLNQKLEASRNLFRLTKSNTSSDQDKSVVYIGRRDVGNQIVDGAPERVSVLEFYETLPKPGTLVHFVLNKKSEDENRITNKFGAIGRVRNRLRNLSSAFKVEQNKTSGDDVIEFDDPEKLVGLTGRIESVHIGNLETTYNTVTEKALVDQIEALNTDRDTEAAKQTPDVVRIKTLTDAIISSSNELDRKRKENGQFNFGEFQTSGSYSSVVLADIRISSDDLTGVVRNVLFADIAVVNPYSNEDESVVLYKDSDGRYKEYETSVYQASHDDTVRITSGGDTLKVNKENLLPRFDNGTEVMFLKKNIYSLATVMGFGDGLYKLVDFEGNNQNIKPEDVQALEKNSNTALDAIAGVNGDTNTIENGLRKSQYVALYHKMLVEDVTIGGVTTKISDELQQYVGRTSDASLEKGVSALNEANYVKYDNASNPPTFGSAPDVLFRAEFTPSDPLTMHKVTGQFNNKAFLEAALVKLNQPGANSRMLADDNNTYEVDRIMGEVVMVTPSGVPGQLLNSDGDVIQNQVITIRYQDNSGVERYANLDAGDLDSIKVPHQAAQVNPLAPSVGYIKVSESSIGNMVPEKAINITAPVRSSLMMAKAMPATFALTSGTEGDTDLLEEEDEEEKGGWTSSWTHETVAAWAASSSSSDEQMLKALSDVEQMVPTWASSSSGDESVEKAAWATSTSASGGFASSTSDDDADDLATIISKIDRVSKPVSAAWAEDSESDD